MNTVNMKNLQIGLLLLRISVFLVMLMWTIDKIVRASHASGVFKNFYNIEISQSPMMLIIGILELILLIVFLIGVKKRISYGLVLIFHFISTISSFKQYLNPFEGPNLLFFAAWPMLAACWILFSLREDDTYFTLK